MSVLACELSRGEVDNQMWKCKKPLSVTEQTSASVIGACGTLTSDYVYSRNPEGHVANEH